MHELESGDDDGHASGHRARRHSLPILRRRWSFAVGLLALTAVLGSCTAPQPGEVSGVQHDLTVEEAKRTAMDMEQTLASMVPAEYVSAIEQKQTGVLLSCDDDRGYQWTGRTEVVTQGFPDADALVDAVVAEYSDVEGYQAQRETTSRGEPSAHVIGEYGAGYLVTESVDKASIEILSFSPCFRLPEDRWAGDTY